MSNLLPSSSHDLTPHRHRLHPSSSIAAIRHVRFRRPTVDQGKKRKKLFSRRKKDEDLDGEEEKSEISIEENVGAMRKIGWRERIKHFTWTWFTMTMATGGIANVIDSIPERFRFPHLYALGAIFFILNMLLFVFNITMISTRFYLYPHTFRSSFVHPTESLFVPAAIISFGTILINITQYGIGRTGPWLETTMMILFWIYCALAILASSGIYLLIWSTHTFTIAGMTPIWIFPAYPLLITGPFASNLAPNLPDTRALRVILGGSILQSLGFLVSLSMYSAFLYRLMTQKLPLEAARPGMFISVGPAAFTSAGVIGMAQTLPSVAASDFMGVGMGELVGKMSVIMANWWGIWLWGLACWWFLVSCGAHLGPARKGKLHFAMTWFSFVFPNTALTTSTFAVSVALHGDLAKQKDAPASARPFQILGLILTVGLVLMWFFVFGMMIRAVILRQILWPQMQEDRDEGGWGKDRRNRKGERMTELEWVGEVGGESGGGESYWKYEQKGYDNDGESCDFQC
ncbi:voltage-dependent anion channel-domain-containing protein [Venturia nashicola]|uniref:Voltage-dependent anion channel-domain-containing protein n=1 Tax=Venturia nashicola TaxID=86259 RepID=A0A4Z1PD88_9PEZI|nr:voltage-dependent anion channel-domain-containing protein [Venturia nashicola]